MQTVKGVINASTLDQLGEGDVEVSVGGAGADEGYDGPGSVLGVVLLSIGQGGFTAEIAIRPQEALLLAKWINETVEALTERDVKDRA